MPVYPGAYEFPFSTPTRLNSMQLSVGLPSLPVSTNRAGGQFSAPGGCEGSELSLVGPISPTLFRLLPSRHSSPLARRSGLSRWQEQRLDPPYHRREEAARQMALRQQKAVVSGMLHQPLLQTGQRPLLDPLRQHQPPPSKNETENKFQLADFGQFKDYEKASACLFFWL